MASPNPKPISFPDAWKLRSKYAAWDSETMVCFDGGGIRGYASLLMLEKLMEKIYHDPENKYRPGTVDDMCPAHYFDYFYGTSTGGLIALMFGRLRMTLGDAKRAYENFASGIFSAQMRQNSLLGSKWNHTNLVNNIDTLVAGRGPNPADGHGVPAQAPLFNNLPSPPDLCKVGVVTYKESLFWRLLKSNVTSFEGEGEAAMILRTYDLPEYNPYSRDPLGKHDHITIQQACRATSAAPTFFQPQEIQWSEVENGVQKIVKHSFIDGGVGTNNPTLRAWKEVCSLRQGSRQSGLKQASKGLTIVSFGTGIPSKSWRGRFSPTKKMLDTQRTHEQMEENVRLRIFEKGYYFRFNVKRGLNKMPMDEYTDGTLGPPGTISTIKTMVDDAFKDTADPQETEMRNCLPGLAKRLVQQREDRTKTQPMWDRLRDCTLHECRICATANANNSNTNDYKYCASWYTVIDELKEHVKQKHPLPAGLTIDKIPEREYDIVHLPYHRRGTKGPW
ncbi:FabD/lysophospholipase-like protein [Zopfia rhizophila CBS 207.26]|uniref:FabD/lysophospholipase-like protein n=1 Tax=Zopfia rhizophila CBS 207.26 TaxID=1314779 RepID=A0A6A6DIH5_9PEZI|nr:FabD/lysophospholipase-like protein [Zopfia rhizophila CBS 207.26]